MHGTLKCYLTDHLAGAAAAIRLLEHLRSSYAGDPLADFAEEIRREIVADEKVLAELTRRLPGPAGDWKRRLARFVSGLGAGKFVRQQPAPFGAFEALETLTLGIQGKLGLWRVLQLIPEPRFAGTDFETLRHRAAQQHAAVERWRLDLAPPALANRAPTRR